MTNDVRPDWASERTERIITIAFIVVGSVFLIAAVVSAYSQLESVIYVWENPEGMAPSRAVMHKLSHELLAGFIGAVLVASGVLRWFE